MKQRKEKGPILNVTTKRQYPERRAATGKTYELK